MAPRKRRPKRREPTAAELGAAVMVLDERLRAIEKVAAKWEGNARRIGFQATSVDGGRLRQDDDDPDSLDEFGRRR